MAKTKRVTPGREGYKSQLEAMIFKMMEQSMKAALDAAMKDSFKDWK